MDFRVPETPVELLQQLVRIPSVNRVSDGVLFVEESLIEYLEQLADAWRWQHRRLPLRDAGCNLLVSCEIDPAAPWLLLDSHLDTVDVAGMTIAPFAADVREGRVWGRGACDTKGSGAAMLWALRHAQLARTLAMNTGILLAVDEEVSKRGVRAFVGEQLPALPWRPVAAIVGEPTSLRIVAAHNGAVRWKIVTRGRAAHSSDPAQGRSAISDMVRVIDALESRYIPSLNAEHPLTGKAQCSINLIRGGSQINVIPAECEISIDRRLVPGEDGNQVLPRVEQVLQALRQEVPGIEVEQLPPQLDHALSPQLGAPLASEIGRLISPLGCDPTPVGARYGTHASDYAAAGIPAIVLGPGNIEQAHRHNEYLELAELERGIAVYRQILEKYQGGGGY